MPRDPVTGKLNSIPPESSSEGEPVRRKGRQIIIGSLAGDDLRHRPSRYRGEKNAVAKVAGSHVIAGRSSLAENRQRVGRARAQAGPIFENLGIPQFGNHGDCSAVQTLNRGGVGAFVEARFLDGASDDDPPIAARDEVNFGRTNHMFQELASGRNQAQHLSFHRAGGKSVWCNLAGPCTRAIDNFRRTKKCFRSGDASCTAVSKVHRRDWIARREIHAAIFRRFDGCRSERPRIDTTFLQVERLADRIRLCQRGLQLRRSSGKQCRSS